MGEEEVVASRGLKEGGRGEGKGASGARGDGKGASGASGDKEGEKGASGAGGEGKGAKGDGKGKGKKKGVKEFMYMIGLARKMCDSGSFDGALGVVNDC